VSDPSRPTSRRATGGRSRGPAFLFVVFVAAAAALFRPAPAHAEKVKAVRVPVRLEYTRGHGAERCPDEAFLRSETILQLGYDPFEAGAPLTVTAHVERQGRELVAAMKMLDREGQTLKADGFGTTGGCKTLVASVALGIAVWLWKPAPPPEPPEPACPQAPPCPACPPPGSAPEPPRREKPPPASAAAPPVAVPAERVRMDMGVGAVMAHGILPGVAAGMELSLGVRQSDWSFALEGRGLGSLGQEVGDALVTTSAFVAAAVVCPRIRPFFGCVLAEVGTWRFDAGDETTQFDPGEAPFLAFAARLGGDWPLSERLSLHGYAEGILPAWAAKLRRGENGTSTSERVLWTPLPVGAAFAVGLTATY
jgi:hypothetical protein